MYQTKALPNLDVLQAQVTDPPALLALIHGGKKDRLYCVCCARFELIPSFANAPNYFLPLFLRT